MGYFGISEAAPHGADDEAVGAITGEGTAHGTTTLAISSTYIPTGVGHAEDNGRMSESRIVEPIRNFTYLLSSSCHQLLPGAQHQSISASHLPCGTVPSNSVPSTAQDPRRRPTEFFL